MKYSCLFTIFCFLSFSDLSAQNLFKSFYFQMPIDDAKAILNKNSKTLKKLSFGNGTNYSFRNRSFVQRDNKLVSINIWSKQNLTLLEATNYLKNTRSHFESQNYKVVYAQENWSNPNLIMKNLPGVRFVDEDKTVLIELYPRGQGTVYNVFVTFYNYGGILAAGMLAHTLVGYRTTKYFAEVTPTASPRNFKKYNDAIINNFEAVDGGSDFPDFLYACGKYSDHHDAAEAAHWPPFHAAFINYIRSSVPNFREDDWSEETKKLVAFLYGVAVHYNADEIWEGLTDELGNGYGFNKF